MFSFPMEAGGFSSSKREIGAQNFRTVYWGGLSLHESFWQIPQRVKLGAAECCMLFVVWLLFQLCEVGGGRVDAIRAN
ncbi:hypothetical protein PIB30_080211 [Stylosanthes scabra]|uniref:Uncharacterized protein n=1 Tax=Stylosanthes scabra TaxID=79078 RepID=A0ABU6WR44_9FABA|nr:hypothetical protein [Stylosanthes scabra]